jgi:hypothetical protein
MNEEMQSGQTDGHRIRIPSDASASEAAAISAAMGAHISERAAAAAREDDADADEDGWDGERFGFAGRLNGVGSGSRRVPETVPTDRWTAAGRTDRY